MILCRIYNLYNYGIWYITFCSNLDISIIRNARVKHNSSKHNSEMNVALVDAIVLLQLLQWTTGNFT